MPGGSSFAFLPSFKDFSLFPFPKSNRDCLFCYKHATNWTFFFDVEEYVSVPTLDSVLNSNRTGVSCRKSLRVPFDQQFSSNGRQWCSQHEMQSTARMKVLYLYDHSLADKVKEFLVHGRGAGVCIQGVLPSAGKAFRSTRSAILASQGIDKHDAPEIGAVWSFPFRSFSGSGSSADKNKLVRASSSFTPMQDKINGEEIAEENTTDDGAERGPARESAKTPDGSRSYDRVNENGEAFVKLAAQECFSNTVLICLTYKHGTLLAADGSLFFQSEQCLIKDDHCKIWNVNERVWLAFAGSLQVKDRASSFLVRDFHHLSTAAAVARASQKRLGIMRVKAGAAGSAGSTILDWLNEENSSRNIENSEFEDALTLCREGIQKSHELGRTSLKFSFIKLEKNEVVFKY
ncbi:hypothetical protein SELMODRAFT_407906 [Selaginella moellendorffii]|uniref:Uncharacterized protein n=1 Tax=Selaginella moellendorffii TaxID=88036 RepID=D8R555_SELML|nr:hypothetical protein SELMODRAFT_407906 [Selaginella moellendorffii]